MKRLIRIFMCALLIGFGVAHITTPRAVLAKGNSSAKTPTGKKAAAKELVADAKKALAAMVKGARADKALDPKTAKNKPFYQSVKKIAKELSRAEKGLAAKNKDFFDAISDARTAEEQMKVTWQLTDSKNKQVIDSGKKLGHALALLRDNYSLEAARKKKGGELTAKEKEEFAKIKAQQVQLLAKIKTLSAKAQKDKALEHGLKEMRKKANRIVKAPETVNGLVATMYAVDQLEGYIYGYNYYVDKEWRGDWINVDAYVASSETVYDEFESVETYEWSDTEVAVDIYENEQVEVSTEVSETEITSEENWAENESFDMSESEEEEVAVEEDTDAEVDSDDADDDDSMDDDSDDDGEDFDGDGDDDGGDDDDDSGGDDDGGDDGD